MPLVRDHLPNQLKAQGLNPEYRGLEPHLRADALLTLLQNTTHEIVAAAKQGQSSALLEALATLTEVLVTTGKLYQLTPQQLREERKRQLHQYGGYTQWYWLQSPHHFPYQESRHSR